MAAVPTINKTSFYNKKTLSWKVRLERQEREFKKNALPVEYHPKLDGPPSDWQSFYRQEDAFKYVQKKGQGLNVFSFENTTFDKGKGERLYLIASYDQFWHYYKQLSRVKRHHYEVIPQGCVCHLYFDLEFLKEFNVGKDGHQMTSILIKFVSLALYKMYQITCKMEDVLQLEASTTDKFSQHLVFHLPDVVFKDNIQVGNFVKHTFNVLYDLIEGIPQSNDIPKDPEEASPTKKFKVSEEGERKLTLTDDELASFGLSVNDLATLIVKDKHNKETLFCDMAVYTKNRNFRLYLSCKLGKDNPLVLSNENKYNPKHSDDKNNEKQIFMDSLITNVNYTSNKRILTFADTQCSSQFSQNQAGSSSSKENECTLSGYQHSPYPEVDNFIQEKARGPDGRGYIRRWSYFPQSELLVYDIAGNRWCENIGRQHNSNNIMLLVDLQASTFYQKCHDPECRAVGFKSKEVEVPKEVLLHHLLDEEDEGADDEITDSELLVAAENIEENVGSKINVGFNAGEEMQDDFEDEELLQAVTDAESSFS